MRSVLLFFIFVPFAEMLLLFEVADKVGGLSTLMLVVLTAVIGVQILKQQGISTLLRANQRRHAFSWSWSDAPNSRVFNG